MGKLPLFLLPYAGGSEHIYACWNVLLPEWIEPYPLMLPGRGRRMGERPLTEWPSAIADTVQAVLRSAPSGPYAIFGHSLGGVLALELAHALVGRGRGEPVWLGVSAATSPVAREEKTHWLDCSEEEFRERLIELNGTPKELLDSQELMDIMMPVLRADFHLSGTYRGVDREPLICPLSVFDGTEDTELHEKPDAIAGWDRETTGPVRHLTIEGGHFYINSQAARLAELVRREIDHALTYANARVC